jgi:hypothetical protein
MKRLMARWKKISNQVLDKQISFFFSLFYWVIISPLALGFKLFSDPFNLRSKQKSFWLDKNTANTTDLNRLKQQF